MVNNIKCWIEAMRLRTLPVSLAGVTAAAGYAVMYGIVNWAILALCASFAVLAQIASNFANEYYDYKDGLDKPGRVGPRRGVTEGDISPRAMKVAAFITLGIAAAVGCCLIPFGGWKLIAAGVIIVLGALSYSAGPYPLSRHALGEVAVFFFFGLVPVTLTFYVQMVSVLPSNNIPVEVFAGAAAVGLLGANILIVNNYRDVEDDRESGKITLAVKWGRHAVRTIYLINGIAAVVLMIPSWLAQSAWTLVFPFLFLVSHLSLWWKMEVLNGSALNPLLGKTALLMFFYTASFLFAVVAP